MSWSLIFNNVYAYFFKKRSTSFLNNFPVFLGHWLPPKDVSILSTVLREVRKTKRSLLKPCEIFSYNHLEIFHDPTAGSITQGHQENRLDKCHFFWRRVHVSIDPWYWQKCIQVARLGSSKHRNLIHRTG